MKGLARIIVHAFFLPSLLSCGKSVPDFSPSYVPANPTEAKALAWLEDLCAPDMAGRKAGTPYALAACNYLEQVIDDLGFISERQDFETKEGDELHNLIVPVIRGHSDTVIVIGSHYDGAKLSDGLYHYPAAEDNASGCVSNLVFIMKAAEFPLETQYDVTCCFWDGEEVLNGSGYYGSRHFVSTFNDIGRIVLYVNLDTIGHEHNNMGVVRSRHKRVADVIDYFVDQNLFNYVVREPYDGMFSDYVAFNSANVPYVGFHDHYQIECYYPNHSTSDKPSVISICKLVEMAGLTRVIVENY